jgi:hypothetical protein
MVCSTDYHYYNNFKGFSESLTGYRKRLVQLLSQFEVSKHSVNIQGKFGENSRNILGISSERSLNNLSPRGSIGC